MTSDEILLDAEERMEKAVRILRDELTGIRSGQATPALVDSLRVEAYGSSLPLKQLATISVPEPAQILIRPFDAALVKDITKAIQTSDLGLTPTSDGRVIRLTIPPLSTERRRQLVARVKELAEESRVAVRNVRRDANRHADQEEKAKTMSEDDCKGTKDETQSLTKNFEGQINELAKKKEDEIMEE